MDSVQRRVSCMSSRGKWVKSNNEISQLCFQELTKNCVNASTLPSLHYNWEIDPDCDVEVKIFDLREICEIINGKTLMFVGDSITAQFATSFLNRVYKIDPQQCDPDMTFFTSGMHEIVCPKNIPNFRIQVVRNDRLSLVRRRPSRKLNVSHVFEEFAWVPLIKIIDPAFIVLNRGAHFVNTTDFIAEVNNTLAFIMNNHPNVTVIWRNTPRGIENHQKSFSDLPLVIAPDPNRPSRYPYAYEQFHVQNELIKHLIANSYHTRYLYWDVAYAMSFREDGHRDPLHYCLPGPMDHWPDFLFNILSVLNNNLH